MSNARYALALIGGLLASPVAAAPLTAGDILAQFNAVIRGSVSTPSDIEGRLVVGGSMGQGATVYNNPNGTTSDFRALTVYGAVGPTTINVNNGGGATIGGPSAATINLNSGGQLSTNAAATLPNFQTTFADPLMALSSSLAAMGPNSTLPTSSTPGWPNNVPIVASAGTGYAVFSMTTTFLESLASFSLDLNGRDAAIINVTGATLELNANFLNAVSIAQDVIWNFVDATSIRFNRQFGGTVLAPDATVRIGTPLEGTLFAAGFTGTGELHNRSFRQDLPGTTSTTVPEPATLALLGLGLAGLIVARKRRGVA